MENQEWLNALEDDAEIGFLSDNLFDKRSLIIASIKTYMQDIKTIKEELVKLSFAGENLATMQHMWHLSKKLYNYQEDVLYFQVGFFTLFSVSLNSIFSIIEQDGARQTGGCFGNAPKH